MRKTQKILHDKRLLLLAGISLLLAGCLLIDGRWQLAGGHEPPASSHAPPVMDTPAVPGGLDLAQVYALTSSGRGRTEFSYLYGDAGNFTLAVHETITLAWEDAPAGADRYDFLWDYYFAMHSHLFQV
jgi:hypothetical protein